MSDAALSAEDRYALARWGLGPVVSATTPASGTVNRTVLLQTSAGGFALRVSSRGRKRVAWEQECIAWAADHGLPVCRPLSLSGGGTFSEHEGVVYSVFPLAAGDQIARGELRAEDARAAGECLARIHAAFQTFPAERACVKSLKTDLTAAMTSVPRIEEAIRALAIRTGTEAAALAQLAGRHDWLRRSVHSSGSIQERLSALPGVIVHGDFQETNLFFAGGAVSAVIDWDQSGLAARGWEVMRALHLMVALDPERCRAFLGGYRSVQALPEGELQEAAACYGVLADGNLWVYEAAYLEGNGRAKHFIRPEPFVPFQQQWQASGLGGL